MKNKLKLNLKLSVFFNASTIVFFFFPWILVSCSGNDFAVISGYRLANGFSSFRIEIDAQPLLYFVTLLSFVILLFYFIFLNKDNCCLFFKMIVFVCFISFIIFYFVYGNVSKVMNYYGTSYQVTYKFGIFVYFLGWLGSFFSSLFGVSLCKSIKDSS